MILLRAQTFSMLNHTFQEMEDLTWKPSVNMVQARVNIAGCFSTSLPPQGLQFLLALRRRTNCIDLKLFSSINY
jgi:hypothetical protein